MVRLQSYLMIKHLQENPEINEELGYPLGDL